MYDVEGEIPLSEEPISGWAFRVGLNDDHEESSFNLRDEEDIPVCCRDFFLV